MADQPPKLTVAERNARNWRNGGYDKFRQGDAQRAKDLPVGGVAPIQQESFPEPKPLKPWPDKSKTGGFYPK